MKPAWEQYLRSVGFRKPLMERSETVIRFYTEIVGIEPSFLFVSEYRDGEQRIYDSLWLCNDETICEAKQFVSRDNFDCVPLPNRITRWEVRSKNFDWVSPRESSRITVHIGFGPDVGGTLQASSENCMRLVEMLKKYLAPNLVK